MASPAFSTDPLLLARVNQARLSWDPAQQALITDIVSHVSQLQSRIAHLESQLRSISSTQEACDPQVKVGTNGTPASKKRKLPPRDAPGANGYQAALWRHGRPDLIAKDISFSLPMRKKLALEVVGGIDGGARVVDTAKGEMEVEAGMAWTDVDQVFALPVPERATATTNFVVLPRPDLPGDVKPEPLVWTVPTTGAPKTWTMSGSTWAEDATYISLLTDSINDSLRLHSKRVITPSPASFVSTITPAHLKDQKSYHIKAFRGSKEGFLYPLSTGILFAFKKPLLYYPFADITCTAYTSILQRTFNLVITTSKLKDGEWVEDQEEFGMLDQADFAPLDAYVKRHGLHDASLAAVRREKTKAVKAENGGAEEEDEEGELAKAERELQDAEDEEEEDFEVGSGSGESDGSGSESEEDGDDGVGGGGGGPEDDDRGDEEEGYELDDDDEGVADEGKVLEDDGRAKRRKL